MNKNALNLPVKFQRTGVELVKIEVRSLGLGKLKKFPGVQTLEIHP